MKTKNLLLTICIFFFVGFLLGQNIEIYVSDAGNWNQPPWQILKFDENGENPEVFINDNIVWPQDIVFLEDQNLVLISNLASPGYISKHDINTGEYLGNFADSIAGPTRMKIGKDGLLYVLQWSNSINKVLRYKLDGTFVDEFTSIGVMQSIGLDWDAEGNLYVSSWGGKFVQKFDASGNDKGKFIDQNLSGPTNIWFHENGELLVIDYSAGAVKRFDSSGEYLGVFIDGLDTPEGVAFMDDGNILIGDGGSSSVKKFEGDGNFINDIIPSGSGDLLIPNAVVIRKTETVSVPENELEKNFIFPTPGKRFLFHVDVFSDIESIEVFNTSGYLVEQKKINNDRVWNASNIADGINLVIANTNQGKKMVQKVIVQ